MNSPATRPLRSRRALDNALTGLGASRGPHISIRGGRFRLVNGAEETLVETHHVDIVVVWANQHPSKTYFPKYEPGSEEPPICFSDNGTGPSTQSMTPQAPTCAVCPWNAQGSALTFSNKPTKACQDRKKLAVLIDGASTVTLYEFQIPPGSMTNFKEYARWLDKQPSAVQGRTLDISDVVTRVTFDPDKQFTMKFEAVAMADDDATLDKIQYIDANNLAATVVGELDVAHDPANVTAMLAGRAPQAAITAPAAQPAPATTPLPAARTPLALDAPAPGASPAIPPAAQGEAPKRRGRPTASKDAPASNVAPFVAPAAPAAAPVVPPQGEGLSIPSFLQRAPAGGAQPPSPPAPRFGVGAAPPPPAAVGDALAAAMSLPTRRG